MLRTSTEVMREFLTLHHQHERHKMNTLEITREATEHEKKFCKDSAFYTWDASEHTHTATVTFGERTIRIFTDGEMRIHLWESKEARERGDSPEVIRYSDGLVENGIDTDTKLHQADHDERIEWINNSWFDLYAYGEGIEDGWLNSVQHDLDEAILQASALIEDDEFWKEVK